MPNLKLTELPTLSPINFTSTDLIYIVDSELNTSNKIPFNLLAGDKLTLLSAYDIENTTGPSTGNDGIGLTEILYN